MLPFANSAHGVRQSTQVGQFRNHRYRSRAWWRRYRARLRKKRAAAELAHRNAMLTLPKNITLNEMSVGSATPLAAPVANPALNSELKSATKLTAAKLPGQLNIAVVALSRPNPVFLTSREESRLLAGVAMSELRRTVIDKMIVAGGWVTNDFVREINGARVFVVTARTPKDDRTPEKAWTFYFTEADGRIYGLTTDAPVEFADRMTTEAERFIASLQAKTESKTAK